MRYQMRLKEIPFVQMLEGKKTLEIRVNDAKRKLIAIDDEILFINRDNPNQTLVKKVVDLRLYNSFADMANNENCILAGFDKGYTAQEVVDCYHNYYSLEEEQQFGVLAIELN
ncbi:MAG: ASCH domain-containing protein [Clostridia bacterium]|nr:ASCH domain-containing protein [Clostridia bacterium]